jgi:hypothetical protein
VEPVVRLNFLIFSILISASAFSADWKSLGSELISQSGSEESTIIKLNSIKDLDDSLKKAIESHGRDEQLALQVIRKMPRLSMVDYLISKAEKMDIRDSQTAHYLVTLLSLNSTPRGADILKFASKKIDLTDVKTSASLRIALLSAMYSRNEAPSVKTMNELLEDVSYELRLKVMDLAVANAEKEPSTYEPILKKALTVSPFPVRLKALEQIKLYPKEVQAHYKGEIEKCAKSDQEETVRDVCKSFRF